VYLRTTPTDIHALGPLFTLRPRGPTTLKASLDEAPNSECPQLTAAPSKAHGDSYIRTPACQIRTNVLYRLLAWELNSELRTKHTAHRAGFHSVISISPT
jgi:hypothetical protein